MMGMYKPHDLYPELETCWECFTQWAAMDGGVGEDPEDYTPWWLCWKEAWMASKGRR